MDSDNESAPSLIRTTSSESCGRESVAIIGCGPGGMSFLHALACKRSRLEEEGKFDEIALLPEVTCYEKCSVPGGVWKAHDGKGESANMYEGLWINGNKESLEYPDYTFDEHFESSMPVFMPRKQILEYMLARVTSKEDIFQNVKFDTTVSSVNYDKSKRMFEITIVDNHSGERSTNIFDNCIWAAGLDGAPNMPKMTKNLLKSNNFAGSTFHSTQVNEFEGIIKGANIVLVGGGYSSEDLALQLIKLGAAKIYIIIRGDYGEVSYVGAWPGNKVEVLHNSIVSGVTEDKKGILYSEVEWDTESERYISDDEGEDFEISNVNAVIFCTGYEASMNMLSKDLRSWYNTYEDFNWSLPDNWKPNVHPIDTLMGDVTPHEELYGKNCVIHDLYRYHLIKNPDMMFVYPVTEYPLLEIDTIAWYLLAYVCGDIVLPTKKQMRQENMKQFMEEMNIPFLRYNNDSNYQEAFDNNIPEDHSIHDYKSDQYHSLTREEFVYENLILARTMIAGNYPVRFGTKDKLNELGERNMDMTLSCCLARYCLEPKTSDSKWRTFRDCDPEPFSSLYTGTTARALRGRWMDLDDDGNLTT